jgi:Tol biopolymer transport system component/predicted Ser/Thr protein kinase
MPLSRGKRLGPYEILDLLGTGGMGEVYRARDTRLDRTVAVKVLTAAAAERSLARTRFEREARAISSLSHPHICAVYDVGHEGGIDYIVMEYLHGESLSTRLHRRALRLEQALQHAVELASALDVAHRAGIVHRDIKPGNVILTQSGAKLLDFGLAKLRLGDELPLGETPDTLTADGTLLGTPAYMSPEQIEGKEADTRSDIFSFGAMLYEMLTQQRAFDGSQGHLLAEILTADPPPPSTLQPLCPPELDHLVARCLAKDPEQRWQSARDMLLELKWAVERPGGIRSRAPHSRRPLAWAVGAALVTGLAVAALLSRTTADPLPQTSPRQVTMAPGWESAPALSPDGGLIAYASNESGNPDIWIVDVRGGNAIRLTDDPASDTDPTWFPDGSALAFTSDRGGGRAIWKVLRFGGAPSLLVPDAEDAALSADGSRIAFTRTGAGGKHRIWTAPLGEPAQAKVLTGDGEGLWDHRGPAFSPDGRTICYHGERDLWLVALDGSGARRLTTDDEADVEPAWSGDGRHIYFSSFRGGAWALWRVASAGGPPTRLTLGAGPERHPALSRDGKRLAYSTASTGGATLGPSIDLVLLDLPTRSESRLTGLNPGTPAWMPDGRSLVFASARIGGRFDLWVLPVADRQASGPFRRLTDQPGSLSRPAVSPDGRWVAYYRVLGGQRDIWMVPAAGGPPLQFTDDPAADVHPAWSPDGRTLAFVSERGGGTSQVWLAPVADGRPAGPARPLTSGTTVFLAPAWSPDGRWIAGMGGTPSGATDVWVFDVSGSARPRILPTEGEASRVRWAPDSKSLFVSGGWDSWVTLRQYDLLSGRRISLDPPIRFGQNPALIDFDISPDGRIVAFGRDELRGDIWALESLDRPF